MYLLGINLKVTRIVRKYSIKGVFCQYLLEVRVKSKSFPQFCFLTSCYNIIIGVYSAYRGELL